MSTSTDTVRSFYTCFEAGDVPGALGLLAPRIEWTEAERSPYFAGTWHGVDAVVEGLFQRIGADLEDFAAAPEEFLAEGPRVVALGTYSGKAKTTGRSLRAPFVHAWTVDGGRLTQFTQYTDTALWREALGL